MRSFSQLVQSAKQACKIEDQSVGFAQERPCDYNASMQLLSGIILFFLKLLHLCKFLYQE